MVYTGKSKNNMDNNWGYPDDLWSLHMLGEEKPEPWCRKWPGWRFQTWREWSTKVWQCLLQRSQNRFAIRTCPTDSTYIYSIYTYIQYIRLYKWVYIIYIYTHTFRELTCHQIELESCFHMVSLSFQNSRNDAPKISTIQISQLKIIYKHHSKSFL